MRNIERLTWSRGVRAPSVSVCALNFRALCHCPLQREGRALGVGAEQAIEIGRGEFQRALIYLLDTPVRDDDVDPLASRS
jgi:hypothetical protein